MNVTWMLKKIVENNAETVPQPSQKVHWAQLFSLPFSHEFRVQNSVHVQANDITAQDSNVWLLQTFHLDVGLAPRELVPCVASCPLSRDQHLRVYCLSDRSLQSIQKEYFVLSELARPDFSFHSPWVGSLPKRARPARCWTRTWISSAAHYKYVKLLKFV